MVTLRVGCYLRVSTRESAENGWSIGGQYGEIRDCVLLGIHILLENLRIFTNTILDEYLYIGSSNIITV